MVKNTYVDHFGPFRTPLDHFGVFASLPLVESTVEPSFHGARERDLIDQKNNWGALISTLSWDTSEIESPKTIISYGLELWPLHLWTGTRIDVCYQIVQNTRLSTMHVPVTQRFWSSQ